MLLEEGALLPLPAGEIQPATSVWGHLGVIYPAVQQPRRLAWTGGHLPRDTGRDTTFLASWPCQAKFLCMPRCLLWLSCLPTRVFPLILEWYFHCIALCTPVILATDCGSPYKQNSRLPTCTSSPTPLAHPHPWLPVTTHLCPTTPEPQRVVPCLLNNHELALTWAYSELLCHSVYCNYNFSNKVWTPVRGRASPSKFVLPWVLSLSSRLPYTILLYLIVFITA